MTHFSHSYPYPAWDLSHGIQSFTRLLQHRSFSWVAVLQELAAPMWALSTGYTPLGTDCCSVGSLRATVPASSLCRHGLSMGCRWLCAPLWSSVSCRDTICFTVVFSTGIPAPVPGTPPPLLHWARCLQGGLSPLARLSPPRSFLSAAVRCFLPLLSRRCYEHHWKKRLSWAPQSWGPLVAKVFVAGCVSCRSRLMSSHVGHPCSHPAAKTLPHKPK